MKALLALLLATVLVSGCSVILAAHSEGQKNIGVASEGVTRTDVLVEFGAPHDAGVLDGQRYEIFHFTRERSDASNLSRAAAYGVAGILTFGLSELVTTPLEVGVGDKGTVTLRVFYDAADRVNRVDALDADGWVPLSTWLERRA